MTQSRTSDALTPDAPRGPIIILGRDVYYAAFPATVEAAIELLEPAAGGEYAAPPADSLDFFDGSGRRLEPIIVGGTLKALALHNDQAEIRYRIDRLHQYLSTAVPRGDRPVEARPFTDENASFEDAIRSIAYEEALRLAAGCPWWQHLLGMC